jgi:hypothetical protein
MITLTKYDIPKPPSFVGRSARTGIPTQLRMLRHVPHPGRANQRQPLARQPRWSPLALRHTVCFYAGRSDSRSTPCSHATLADLVDEERKLRLLGVDHHRFVAKVAEVPGGHLPRCVSLAHARQPITRWIKDRPYGYALGRRRRWRAGRRHHCCQVRRSAATGNASWAQVRNEARLIRT